METGSTTICLADYASGRVKVVPLKAEAGAVARENGPEDGSYSVEDIPKLLSTQVTDSREFASLSDTLQNGDPRLCEAVLRSVFAPRAPGESLDDCVQNAEIVKRAFTLHDTVYSKAESRALKVAQYRRAEVQMKLEALKRDDDMLVPPTQFADPAVYQSWKVEELQNLSNLVNLFGNLPSFSGGVQVEILSGEDLKPMNASSCILPAFSKKPAEISVYCSVSILPAKAGTTPSPPESEDGLERTPVFFSEVVVCNGNAEWQTRTSWIPIGSSQDRILIEVWEKVEAVTAADPDPETTGETPGGISNFRQFVRRQSSKRKKKVAPWSSDTFLGQVIVSFSHIESQALAQGGVQGQSPATSYMLADERGKQSMSTIQLQFSCSCERFYRDAPPNKLLLMPPIEEIETAFDNLVRLAFHAEKGGGWQLGQQWRQLVYGFGAHYRIREERCVLGLVNIMAGLFQQDARYCEGIVQEWLPACHAAKNGRLTRNELALHCNIVVSLMKPAINSIENFHSTFPENKPAGVIPKLIELLGLILRWDPDPSEIVVPLRTWIQSGCEHRLNEQVLGETDGGGMREMSAQSLVQGVRMIRADLIEYKTTFKSAFPDNFDLLQVTASVYYRLISHYVVTFIGAASLKTSTKELEDLVVELSLLHEDLQKSGAQFKLLDLRSLLNGQDSSSRKNGKCV
ncbi:unnamed protein product [Sphagnum troendelagicum]|uniref:Uncharacterized protein n=1 Tax=Sphagnum troendelagicum TaxID=128251 RepID=A0ABP0V041_9BRYO